MKSWVVISITIMSLVGCVSAYLVVKIDPEASSDQTAIVKIIDRVSVTGTIPAEHVWAWKVADEWCAKYGKRAGKWEYLPGGGRFYSRSDPPTGMMYECGE